MTILQSLDRYYGRMAARGEVAPFGYVDQQIGYALVVTPSGDIDSVRPLGQTEKKRATVTHSVPAPVTEPKARTAGAIVPYFLWDKPSYLLGIETGETNRARKYAASRALHLDLLANATDPVLLAVRRYFERYPEGVPEELVPAEFRDRPYVLRTTETLVCAQETEEARTIWTARQPRSAGDEGICLITGDYGPIQRLHPKIGGFKDADTLVGFDKDAFTSYGKSQGANAPTSEGAAFRYSTALNRMLDRGSRNRLPRPVGDASLVFWADTSDAVSEDQAHAAEGFFALLSEPPDDEAEAAKLSDALEKLAEGRPLRELTLGLAEGTRFHVLGLAPNAARLSVRYWLDDDFAAFAKRLADHYADLVIEPTPWRGKPPSIQRLLVQVLVPDKRSDNARPGEKISEPFKHLEKHHALLAGELTRSVLTGARYPRTLLTAAMMRLRAGDDPGTGWHAAAIRAVLARQQRMTRTDPNVPKRGETPVSLDREHSNTGYQLGRLFAVYELAQRAALGKDVRSTIRDKYFGAASTAPASVFPTIISNGQNHLSKVRKEKPGWAYTIETELEEVIGRIKPTMPFSLPRSLRLEDQGEFAIGYYHQRKAKLGDGATDQPSFESDKQEGGDENGE